MNFAAQFNHYFPPKNSFCILMSYTFAKMREKKTLFFDACSYSLKNSFIILPDFQPPDNIAIKRNP
jgi:hypothetical protein